MDIVSSTMHQFGWPELVAGIVTHPGVSSSIVVKSPRKITRAGHLVSRKSRPLRGVKTEGRVSPAWWAEWHSLHRSEVLVSQAQSGEVNRSSDGCVAVGGELLMGNEMIV